MPLEKRVHSHFLAPDGAVPVDTCAASIGGVCGRDAEMLLVMFSVEMPNAAAKAATSVSSFSGQTPMWSPVVY